VKPVTDQELIDGALTGMLESLDPHSAYMNKAMYSQMEVDTSGKFGGLGIEISGDPGGVRVVAPIEDTPADKVGIKAGDLIIKIDDHLAKDMTLQEAVNHMRGKPGTSVKLTIFRKGAPKPLEFTVVRAGAGLCVSAHHPVLGSRGKPADQAVSRPGQEGARQDLWRRAGSA
jgi:carboxyl-terminal processing protease